LEREELERGRESESRFNAGECKGQNSGNMFNAVSEITPINLWAAGFQFNCHGLLTTMMLHGDGKSWHVVATPPLRTNDNSAFNGVVALATHNVYAVGYQPAANGAVLTLIEHFNGSAWSVVPSPNGNSTGNVLQAISADSPTDIWAVGDRVAPNIEVQTLVEHFDGSRWTVVPSPNPVTGSDLDQNVMLSVKALSPTDVTARRLHPRFGDFTPTHPHRALGRSELERCTQSQREFRFWRAEQVTWRERAFEHDPVCGRILW
jgi:hypothetical protein